MIRRATLDDVAGINARVEQDCGQSVDFSAFIANDMNVCLMSGDGGALFVWRGPGVYELHLFLVERGKEAIAILKQMLAAIDARLFWAAIPVASRNVIMFARLMGWKSEGLADLPHGLCELFTLENN